MYMGCQPQESVLPISSTCPACGWVPAPLQWPPTASLFSCAYYTSDMLLPISELSFLLIIKTTQSARYCPIGKWRNKSLVGIGGLAEITYLVRNTTKTGTMSLIPKAPHPGPLERVHRLLLETHTLFLSILFNIEELKWQVWLCITALLISLWMKHLVDFYLTSKESDYQITIEELLAFMFCNYDSCWYH